MRLSRLLAPLAAIALMLNAAWATDVTQMTATERSAFDAEIRAYLLQHPEVLMEAIQVLQDRQQQATDQQDKQLLMSYHQQIYSDPASWVSGNLNGDVTVVEFMDYRCTYCRHAYSEVTDLVKTDGKIRFVVKEFPILGPDSVTSSQFAIAVKLLGGDAAYAKAHDALMTLRGKPDTPTLTRLAEKLGLDAGKVLDTMNSAPVQKIIADNLALGTNLGVNGTPTFVVGDSVVRGYLPEDQMKQIVAQQRNAG